MWRVRLDTAAGMLALEARDGDILLTHFYTLNCHDHSLHQLRLPDPNTWWLGLEDVHQGQVYLHGYGDRKLGQHKGIRALSAITGEELWHRQELTFYGMDIAGLLAYTPGQAEGRLQLLDTRYGSTVQNDISQKEAAERVQAFGKSRYSAVTYPVLYREGEEYFSQVRDFMTQHLDCEPVKVIEYAETDSFVVISYYVAAAGNKLDNFLAIFDLNGFLHLNESLASGLNGVGSDTFFIFMRSLYFVQNKAILKAYSLIF